MLKSDADINVNTAPETVDADDRADTDHTPSNTNSTDRGAQTRRVSHATTPDSLILRNVRNAVIVTDLNGIVTYWNEGAKETFGYTEAEMLGNTLEGLYPKQKVAEFAADLEKINSGQEYIGEWRGRRPDGTPVYVEIRTSLMRDAAGEPAGYIGVSVDITQRKLAEQAMEHNESRLDALERANVIGIITANRDSIISANQFFLRMVGYTEDDLERGEIRWPEMTPAEYLSLDDRGIQELVATGICHPFEKELFRKDGSRVPILLGAVKLQSDPLHWVCFVLDLSAQKALEGERSELLTREKEARQRLQDFLAIIAHELAQPVTAIRGNTQLVRRRLSETAPREVERLKAIEEAAGRMQRLVSDLRDAAFIGTGRFSIKPEQMDLVETLHHVVAQRKASSASATIEIESPDKIIGVWDPDRVAQLVSNLVGNAITYSPKGCAVRVTVEDRDSDVVIRVIDVGPGISLEQQQTLFQPFSRLDTSAGAGSGLGLYICKGIAEAHGGDVRVESVPGEGSSFIVSLPRSVA